MNGQKVIPRRNFINLLPMLRKVLVQRFFEEFLNSLRPCFFVLKADKLQTDFLSDYDHLNIDKTMSF